MVTVLVEFSLLERFHRRKRARESGNSFGQSNAPRVLLACAEDWGAALRCPVLRAEPRLTPAAPPSATHPRRSRGPPAGGSAANPRDWRRAVWGRARADASSRAAPRPACPRAHGLLTTIRKLGNSRKAFSAHDDAASKRPANRCAAASPACMR